MSPAQVEAHTRREAISLAVALFVIVVWGCNVVTTQVHLVPFFDEARKKGVTGHVLLQSLERRLDTACVRLGFASSQASARQLVSPSATPGPRAFTGG